MIDLACFCEAVRPIGGPLRQWDTGREVRVDVPGATQALFAAGGWTKALVAEVTGGTSLVPDSALVPGSDVTVWASDGKRALSDTTLCVKPRAKPDDYVYTPDEVQTWADIRDWVNERLAHAGEPGTKWYTGSGAPAIGGRPGDLYLDTATGRYYRYGEQEGTNG